MSSLASFYNQLLFFLSTLTWVGLIDLALVTAAFYLILSLLRRSTAAFLLREVVILVVGLFFITTILPLPVFDWLVRAFLLAVLVATPIVFQAQIRQFLSQISRTAGIARAARQDAAETVIPEIVHATENMAATQTGALIVCEGLDPLDEIAHSGINTAGRVTSELLQSIFYEGTPLHDGAVIIRADRLLAAACVLPLTQQPLQAEKRLGTRHRAAVGMSETSDALVVVVSEETGLVGVAQNGQLNRPLNSAELRDRLQDFFEPAQRSLATPSLWSILKSVTSYAWHSTVPNSPRQFISNAGLLLMSFALTVVVWTFVLQQTNAIELARIEGIPLRVEGQPPNTRLIPAPPTSVSAIIQAPKELIPTLGAQSFQAVVEIENQNPGVYRLPVKVVSGVNQVMVVSAEPETIDVELARIIEQVMPVEVYTPDLENMSPAYEMVGTPSASPDTVQVLGPEPLINTIEVVRATVSVANANTSIRENRPIVAVDGDGNPVTGITIVPDQVRVNVNIRQRVDAREASVQASIEGAPPEGYQLRAVSVSPSSVTLRGSTGELEQLGGTVSTVPIDISEITGDITLQAALELPSSVQALDSSGTPIRTVDVLVRVSPLNGNLTQSRPVEMINTSPIYTYTVTPQNVDLLLSGPVPTLNEIEADPNMVRVLVDASGVRRGQSTNITPQLVAPPGVEAQLVPPSVQVTAE
ncbi:MAG: hypothetical protein Kow0031_11060 [Anaerolineae bacterium]